MDFLVKVVLGGFLKENSVEMHRIFVQVTSFAEIASKWTLIDGHFLSTNHRKLNNLKAPPICEIFYKNFDDIP